MSLTQLLATIGSALLTALSGIAVAWVTARHQRKGCRIKVDGVIEVEGATVEDAEKAARVAIEARLAIEPKSSKPDGTKQP